MYYIVLAKGGLLDVDPGLFFWIFVTFGIFIYAIGKIAWKPILGALSQREMSIRDSLQAAEEAIKKAEKISADNQKALREAEAIAQKIRKDAIAEAELVRTERIEKAKEEASTLLSQARTTIEAEKKRALEDLRNEVADLAIRAAKVVLDAELDAEKNKKLVDNFIKDLSNN
jgi:F-type H+-transporting ATPase subunit b